MDQFGDCSVLLLVLDSVTGAVARFGDRCRVLLDFSAKLMEIVPFSHAYRQTVSTSEWTAIDLGSYSCE